MTRDEISNPVVVVERIEPKIGEYGKYLNIRVKVTELNGMGFISGSGKCVRALTTQSAIGRTFVIKGVRFFKKNGKGYYTAEKISPHWRFEPMGLSAEELQVAPQVDAKEYFTKDQPEFTMPEEIEKEVGKAADLEKIMKKAETGELFVPTWKDSREAIMVEMGDENDGEVKWTYYDRCPVCNGEIRAARREDWSGIIECPHCVVGKFTSEPDYEEVTEEVE